MLSLHKHGISELKVHPDHAFYLALQNSRPFARQLQTPFKPPACYSPSCPLSPYSLHQLLRLVKNSCCSLRCVHHLLLAAVLQLLFLFPCVAYTSLRSTARTAPLAGECTTGSYRIAAASNLYHSLESSVPHPRNNPSPYVHHSSPWGGGVEFIQERPLLPPTGSQTAAKHRLPSAFSQTLTSRPVSPVQPTGSTQYHSSATVSSANDARLVLVLCSSPPVAVPLLMLLQVMASPRPAPAMC